jgi:hypothetical protein
MSPEVDRLIVTGYAGRDHESHGVAKATVRGFISILESNGGIKVTSTRREDGARVYETQHTPEAAGKGSGDIAPICPATGSRRRYREDPAAVAGGVYRTGVRVNRQVSD